METDRIKQKPYILAIDFDGVIHQYSKGWDDGSIYDPPMVGSKETLEKLLALRYNILIHSVRLHERGFEGVRQSSQAKEMRIWWKKHNLPDHPDLKFWEGKGKPLAHIYLDDRALLFCDWNQAFKDIVNRYPY